MIVQELLDILNNLSDDQKRYKIKAVENICGTRTVSDITGITDLFQNINNPEQDDKVIVIEFIDY